jgi:hypothetical protein
LLLAVFVEFFAAGTGFEVSEASLAVGILRLDLRGASNSSLSDCFALRFGIFGYQLPSDARTSRRSVLPQPHRAD